MTSGVGRRPGLTSKILVPPHSHTGEDIVDGSIVNADIGAAAAIAQSKIANLTSDLAGKASITHTHSASDITTGTVAAARRHRCSERHDVPAGRPDVGCTCGWWG